MATAHQGLYLFKGELTRLMLLFKRLLMCVWINHALLTPVGHFRNDHF
jgi:hypothetical protein